MSNLDDPTTVNRGGPPDEGQGAGAKKSSEQAAPATASDTPIELAKTVVMSAPGKALGSGVKKPAEKPAPAADADLSKTVVMSSPGRALGSDVPKPSEKAVPPAPRPAATVPAAAALGADTPIDQAKTVVTTPARALAGGGTKPATPPAPKPAAPPAAAAAAPPEPNMLRRRLTWTCIVAFLTANLLMFLRFFFPRALFEPSTICNLGYPSDYVLGVSERFKQQCRIYVIRDPTRIFAVFAKCTHLGCTPDWKPAENKFKCPCHGSGYTPEAINFEGPAPRPMDRAHVELNAQGQIIADTSRLYMWDRSKGGRNEFDDAGAFVSV
ncbi:MAG: Rieske 2Fe-2S domain-containing protein [Terriglobia bacterium]|jgi:cytochrome b6-f complex iron-sulfur subunit